MRVNQSEIALVLRVTPSAVSQWFNGGKPPADRCPAIERATDGKVTVDELRPDVRWHRIPDPAWPHPQGRPAIDVAAPKETRDEA